MDEAQQLLASGLKTLGLETQQSSLLAYMNLLQKWNRSINLTAITDTKEMVIKHLLDSLSIAPHVKGSRIIDIGTGGGLPGIPLAIHYPEKSFVLCDSVGKKCVFLKEVTRKLGLLNVEVVHSRIETYKPTKTFDMIVSRALAKAPKMIGQSHHLLQDEGVWLLMKGEVDKAELKSIDYPHQCVMLDVPYLKAQRHVILIEKNKHN